MARSKGRAGTKKARTGSAPGRTDGAEEAGPPGRGPANDDAAVRELRKRLERLEKENRRLEARVKALKEELRSQKKKTRSLEGKMDTRIKREDIIMTALGIHSRTRKGQRGAIDGLEGSIMKTDEFVLNMGRRLDSIMSAVKNHREHLIRLNNRVYKQDHRARLEMELEIMSNTLAVMALSGFDINRTLFSDVKRIRGMMEDKKTDMAKLKKRMSSFTRKFEEEMERFDFESIYRKADNIPGYR